MKMISVTLLAILVLAACNRNVLTGSKLTLDNYNKITTGMSKAQVVALVGDPVVADPFHHERWDYVASEKRGHKKTQIKNLTLWFEGDSLSRMEGEYFPEEDADLLTEMREFGFYNLPKEKDDKKRGGGG